MGAFRRSQAAVEGAFASYNPRFQVLAGASALVAEPNGVAIGRFAWADQAAGLAYSNQTTDSNATVLGFVLRPSLDNMLWPTYDWRRTYYDRTRCAWISRGGFEVTLARSGDFWARFPGGSYPGMAVYASVTDGSCAAFPRNTGPVSGYVQTPWFTVSNSEANCLAIISTWSFFS